MNIYVGTISYESTEEELRDAFATHGEVASAKIITDRESGDSKGFGFVEMPNDDEANKAISSMDGFDLGGRELRVNQARPKEDRPRGNSRRFNGRNSRRNANTKSFRQ